MQYQVGRIKNLIRLCYSVITKYHIKQLLVTIIRRKCLSKECRGRGGPIPSVWRLFWVISSDLNLIWTPIYMLYVCVLVGCYIAINLVECQLEEPTILYTRFWALDEVIVSVLVGCHVIKNREIRLRILYRGWLTLPAGILLCLEPLLNCQSCSVF